MFTEKCLGENNSDVIIGTGSENVFSVFSDLEDKDKAHLMFLFKT